MATLTQNQYFTIADLAKQIDPNGNIAIIAETLAEMNEYLGTAVATEANQSFSDVGTKRIKLPTVSARRPNEAATKSKGETAQVREGILLFDVLVQIDEAIADHAPNRDELRRNAMAEQMEAYMQEFARVLSYGDSSDPNEISGFLTRYNDSSLDNVWDQGGTGSDLSSILLVEWNKLNCKLIYPKGSPSVGIQEEDLGKILVSEGYRAYVNQVKMEFGLSVLDDSYVARVANIETTGTTSNLLDTNGINNLVYAVNHLKHAGRNARIYVNRTLKAQFDIWALNKANGFYPGSDVSGSSVTVFRGIPIHMVEQLTDTESAI